MNSANRRDFLKLGAALPLAMHALDARAVVRPKVTSPPRRIMFICNSLGFYEPSFFPTTRGDLDSSKYLQGMAVKDKMTVLQGLYHPGMETSNHDSEKSFLTGAPKPEAPNFTNSISVDQVLSGHMGNDTRFPYLPLSIYDRGWGCSWNSRGVAIPPLHDETQIFAQLFGEEDLTERQRQLKRDQQIIQCLYRDMEELKKRGSDTEKLDAYRTVVAELEERLAREQFWLKTKKPDVTNTLSGDQEFAFSTKIRNLLELAKLAFRTDSTRVITFSMDWIYGAIKVPGATGGWHTLSHHGGRKEALEKLSRIEIDILRHLNRFLLDLDQIKEGDGTLLDHTTVVIGSNFGDSSNHTCNNLPTIVAGVTIAIKAISCSTNRRLCVTCGLSCFTNTTSMLASLAAVNETWACCKVDESRVEWPFNGRSTRQLRNSQTHCGANVEERYAPNTQDNRRHDDLIDWAAYTSIRHDDVLRR